MANETTVDPRYLKYETKNEVEALLEKVENMPGMAKEDDVRSIVSDYS